MVRGEDVLKRIKEKAEAGDKLKQIPVRMPKELYDSFKAMVDELGVKSLNEFTVTMIELAVEEYMKSKK